MIFVFDRVKNIVGKGVNAGHQHLLFFPQCFQRAFYPGLLKVGVGIELRIAQENRNVN